MRVSKSFVFICMQCRCVVERNSNAHACYFPVKGENEEAVQNPNNVLTDSRDGNIDSRVECSAAN